MAAARGMAEEAAQAAGLKVPAHPVCCYPVEDGFVRAYAALIRSAIEKLRRERGDVPFRLLLSAHGLPKRVVEGGDPYQAQVEQSAAVVVGALGEPGLDWQVCYQSRVGPLEWIGPATDDEIERYLALYEKCCQLATRPAAAKTMSSSRPRPPCSTVCPAVRTSTRS